MLVPNRHSSDPSRDYRYSYQGSEKDNELKGEANSYTTHYRMLDPRVGKWMSRDPKFTAFETPYSSMSNNPIWYNDKLGDTIRYRGSENFNKFYQKTIAMLSVSGSKEVKEIITYLQKSKHDIILMEGENPNVQPKSVFDYGIKYTETGISELDITDPDYEQKFEEVYQKTLELRKNSPTKHLNPDEGDGSYVFLPNPNEMTKNKVKQFGQELNKEGNKVRNDSHTLIMHELFHSLRIAKGIMIQGIDEFGNPAADREKEEIEAVQFVNRIYRSLETRSDLYQDKIEIPLEEKFKNE